MIGRDLVISLCVEVGSKNAIRMKLCLGRGVGAFFDFVLEEQRSVKLSLKTKKKQALTKKATPAGFEPARAEPNGLAGHRLNHSAKVSSTDQEKFVESF